MLRTAVTIGILGIAFASAPGLAETWDCGTSTAYSDAFVLDTDPTPCGGDTGYSNSFKLDTEVSDCTGWAVASGGFMFDTVWSPGTVKKRPLGTPVTLNPLPITRIFADRFYIEAADRSSGIGVEYSLTDPEAEPGRLATVIGRLADVEGEVMLAPRDPPDPPEEMVSLGDLVEAHEPFLLTNRNVGGGPELPQRGITGASGLNNIGLLICTTGSVTHADTDSEYFYIDDGLGLWDGSCHDDDDRPCDEQPEENRNIGVKVLATGLSIPAENSYVKVTGISSCFADDPDLHRLIRVQNQADIEVPEPVVIE